MDMYSTMKNLGINVCPICKKEYQGYPAVSRKDNKTLICSDCGVKEAIQAHMIYMATRCRNNKLC